tara:strand:+ start:644 stop:940 length:297 start_codon:yes stop_codon:yes gene_type:complete
LPKKTSIKSLRDLKIGDLVSHALYGKEWVGLIVDFVFVDDLEPEPKEKALVQIQPGTKHEGFFKDRLHTKSKVTDNLGYVSIHWLFKLEKQTKKGHKK